MTLLTVKLWVGMPELPHDVPQPISPEEVGTSMKVDTSKSKSDLKSPTLRKKKATSA
jgi:hypothetical protein